MAFAKEEKFLINAGYTRASFQEEFGFSFDEFEDEDNWFIDVDGKKRFMMNGVVYDLVFDYSEKVLKRMN